MEYQTIDQINFNELTDKELKAIRQRITSVLNYRFGNALHEAKKNLYIGARCKVDHPKAYGKTFIVEKINPKNVKCRQEGAGTIWNITASMLEMI